MCETQIDESIILHVDLDSFFATVEQQVDPSLRGKPVGVVKAKVRTCIIASAVEAKKQGVKMCFRVNEARQLWPQIVLVPADFAKYQDVSKRFIEICSRFSPEVEVFSLDECFIDVTESVKFWHKSSKKASIEKLAWLELAKSLQANDSIAGAFNIAFEIKERIKCEIGEWITCSVGISHNRLFSKLGSTRAKPNGIFWVTCDNALQVLDRSKLMDVCGIGVGLYRHLVSLGINSFPKLRILSLQYLHKHFGPFWSRHLYNLARGVDNSLVTSYRQIPEAKSVGRTYTTHRFLRSEKEVFKLVRNLCEEAAFKARQMNMTGRYVGLTVRGNKTSFSGHKTLKSYINDGKVMFSICQRIAGSWNFGSVIFCGVTLAMLTKNKYLSEPILETDIRHKNLVMTVDKINERFGNYTVFPGQLLGMSIVMPEVTGYFGDKKYQLDYS